MIENIIVENYKDTLKRAQKTFTTDNIRYGTYAWRILRLSSVLDEIYAKAYTLNQLGLRCVLDDINSNLLSITNYNVAGIIQNIEKPARPGDKYMSSRMAWLHYMEISKGFNDYLLDQNPYLIEQIYTSDIKVRSEVMYTRALRLKKLLKNHEGTKVVEGGFLELILWSAVLYPNDKVV